MALQDMIAAAEKRANESEGSEKTKAEGELQALKAAQSAGYTFTQDDVNSHAGSARTKGRDNGKDEARKEVFRSLGIDPEAEDADEKLSELKKLQDSSKSEFERLEAERDSWKQKAESAEKERDENRQSLRQRDRTDAIRTALSEAKYEGKTNHALNAIDLSKVKEEDGKFDASEAVEALRKDEFPGFQKLEDPEQTPQGGQSPTGQTAAEKFNERLKRRGRPVAN